MFGYLIITVNLHNPDFKDEPGMRGRTLLAWTKGRISPRFHARSHLAVSSISSFQTVRGAYNIATNDYVFDYEVI